MATSKEKAAQKQQAHTHTQDTESHTNRLVFVSLVLCVIPLLEKKKKRKKDLQTRSSTHLATCPALISGLWRLSGSCASRACC